ncbi:hypothetical protein M426DRAFT_140921 [Hypoxylon sp. CI-4A]|nr:hypothetical protein M426DRAFT_140921 [Hypoxylon sp. CI-4A]
MLTNPSSTSIVVEGHILNNPPLTYRDLPRAVCSCIDLASAVVGRQATLLGVHHGAPHLRFPISPSPGGRNGAVDPCGNQLSNGANGAMSRYLGYLKLSDGFGAFKKRPSRGLLYFLSNNQPIGLRASPLLSQRCPQGALRLAALSRTLRRNEPSFFISPPT